MNEDSEIEDGCDYLQAHPEIAKRLFEALSPNTLENNRDLAKQIDVPFELLSGATLISDELSSFTISKIAHLCRYSSTSFSYLMTGACVDNAIMVSFNSWWSAIQEYFSDREARESVADLLGLPVTFIDEIIVYTVNEAFDAVELQDFITFSIMSRQDAFAVDIWGFANCSI